MDADTVKSSTPPLEEKATVLAPRSDGAETVTDLEQDGTSSPKDLRFWLIIMGLLVATFLSALDLTGKIICLPRSSRRKHSPQISKAISTALPTIAHTLKSEDFTWIGNAYSITATSVIPW